jgi:hypothetical protein
LTTAFGYFAPKSAADAVIALSSAATPIAETRGTAEESMVLTVEFLAEGHGDFLRGLA